MDSMTALMTQAETYLLQKDYDRATEMARRAKSFDPASCEPDIMVARVAIELDRTADATVILENVLTRSPHHGYANMLRGLAHEAGRQFDAALMCFEQATRFAPTLMPAWFNRGRLLVKKERHAEAAIAFERAAGLESDNVTVLAAWAQTLSRIGNVRRAANTYLRCIEMNVANPLFMTELADLLAKANELNLAEEVLSAGSNVFSSQGLFDSKRAALALLRKDLTAAVRFAREAVRRQPDCIDFLLGLALIETMRLNMDQARLAAERALAIDPQSWKANFQLGIVYESAKLRERAIAFYRRAVELAPQAWRPRNNLAVLLLEGGSESAVHEAIEHLTQATCFTPSATAVLNLALAQLRAGHKSLARQLATKASHLGLQGSSTAEQARHLAAALVHES